MSSDPYDPNYQPDDQGAPPGTNVGSGNQFGIDLYYLYRAGRLHFPEQAARFSKLASDAQYAGYTVKSVQSEAGYPAALGDLLELRDRLHTALYKMATSLAEIGPVLVQIADDYAATDEAAKTAFKNRMTENRDDYAGPPVYVPPPPPPNQPYEPPTAPPGIRRPGMSTPL